MTQKKISRRDAIKLLGAVTGATVLANLPSKWKTPEIARGVLPAHAQTSNLGLTIASCDFTWNPNTGEWSSTPHVIMSPPSSTLPLLMNIAMKFTITFAYAYFAGSGNPQNPNPYIGNWTIDATTGSTIYVNNTNGALSNAGLMLPDLNSVGGHVTILWEFNNSSQGTGSCSEIRYWGGG